MGGQGNSAHLRTLHRNPAQERWSTLVERAHPLVSYQCSNWPAAARLSGSARAIFHLIYRGTLELSNLCRAPDRASASFRPRLWNLVAPRSVPLAEQCERKPPPNQGPPAPRLDARRFEESKSIAVPMGRPSRSSKNWTATGPRHRRPVRSAEWTDSSRGELGLANLPPLRTTSSVDDYSDDALLLWSHLRAGRKPSWSESPMATRHRKSLRESVPKSSAPSRFQSALR